MAYVAVQAMAAGILKSHSMGATTVAEAMAGVSVSSPEGNVTVNATTHLVGQGMLALHVEPTSTGVQVVKVIDIPFTTFNYSS
jgi:ABC-type branched-subunit amino acid transport system substrate-binding protein